MTQFENIEDILMNDDEKMRKLKKNMEEKEINKLLRKYGLCEIEGQNVTSIKELQKYDSLIKEIGPIKKFIYDVVLKTTGKNLYRNEVVNYKNNLLKEKGRIEQLITDNQNKIYGKNDEREDQHISKKGLVSQMDNYQKICNGFTQTAQKMNSIRIGLESKKALAQDKVQYYGVLLENKPGNEDYSNKYGFFQGKFNKINDDLNLLKNEKSNLEKESQYYHERYETAKSFFDSSISTRKRNEEALFELNETIFYIEMDLKFNDKLQNKIKLGGKIK